MLFAALLTLLTFALAGLVFSLIAYAVIYGSFIFAYFCLWDDDTRRAIAPKGIFHAILYDE